VLSLCTFIELGKCYRVDFEGGMVQFTSRGVHNNVGVVDSNIINPRITIAVSVSE
jgi:hypothetical protein